MKRNIMIMFVASIVLACMAIAQSEKATHPKTADDVQKLFSERVYSELLPQASELSSDEVMEKVSSIADEILVPHKAVLLEKTKADLADLPQLKVELDDWETVVDIKGSFVRQAMTKMNKDKAEISEGALLVLFGNPVQTAQSIRGQALVKHMGPDQFGARYMIERIGGAKVYALNPDPLKPVIAIQTGPELFVVNLIYNDKGYYIDEKVQWVKNAGASHKHDS